ncbi:vWA domain-containing protein [Sulfitobacter guttiformis]|uniref:Putative metal-dependent peptidase n=1 Tax=Sulfitobacter guttiformis TaxID=74349 RepID=A0A420DTV6_9RHOB|nr:VWA-like domain-containing protein [Sulfitobacter guttiformis]KIN71212.1 putative metallopeptidase [Sulfitobacter guttiformis KCTC 32187]RKE97682.1 putative metal-dependent peptidase [Sulfitobacter guttiformis]
MSTERHSIRAAPALRALAEADPAIAALSLWCIHRDDVQTVTTGEVITYGPDFGSMPLHEQMGLAAHHVLHVALRHSARAATLQARLGSDFDAALFNLAADALINEAVLAGDHALPRPAVLATALIKHALGREVTATEVLAEWDAERLYFALAGRGSEGAGRGSEAQDYATIQKFYPDLEQEAGMGEVASTVQDAARWRQHITRAIDAGRSAGRGIGRIGHHLADVASPRVPWEQILRRVLTHAVMQAAQPSPQRPKRRWIAATAQALRAGTPEPGFEAGNLPRTDVPRIAIAIDASSSIDDARLSMFWAEVTGIARRMRAELHLMVFDDQIRHRARIDPNATQIPLPEMPRGGGTAFIPVITEAKALGAAALVIFTDLEGDAGPPPRGLHVIWALCEAGSVFPPFGKLIDLSR